MPIVFPQPLPSGTVPDASGTVAGKVNLVAQTLGAGAKTVEHVITPIVSNTNGTISTDVCVKIGSSVADGLFDPAAKLLSLRTGIGGTEVERLSVNKYGAISILGNLSTYCGLTISGAGGPGVNVTSGIYTGITSEATSGIGLQVQSTSNYAVEATSNSGTAAVSGQNNSGIGIKGSSNQNYGLVASGAYTGYTAAFRILPRPTTPTVGDVGAISVIGTGPYTLNWYDGTTWQTLGGGGGGLSMGAFGSTPNANGGTITSGVLYLQPANATYPGGITAADYSRLANTSGTNTGDQNLSGYALLTGATFSGSISASNLSGTNTGDQNLSGYALLTGAAFTGEVSFPYAKFNPGSAPGTPVEGHVYYDSAAHSLRFRDSSTWIDCGGAGSVPDASGSVAGKVNLVAQVLGAGVKTITDGLVTPIVSNTNGTGASDLVVQIGTSVADGSVNSSAKLLSLRTGIGGTPVEKLFVLKSGSLTSASSLAMLSDPSAPVSSSGGIAWRSNAGVAELSSNGGSYTSLNSMLTIDTPTQITSTSNHIAVSLTSGRHFYHTMTENTTLDAPSGVAAGMKGCIDFYQHASSAKTLAFNAFWKFGGGAIPALSTTAGTKHLLVWYVGHDTSYATCKLIGMIA